MATPTLQRSEVREVSRMLRAKGMKLPKSGYCVSFREPNSSDLRRVPYGGRYNSGVCRDHRGYYLLESTTRFLNGYKRRRRSRR